QALGFVEGIERFSETLGSVSFRSPETVSVVAAPIIVVAAVLLWRLAGLLHAGKLGVAVPGDQAALPSTDGFTSLNKIIVFVLRAVALISVPLVLLGYVYLARQISDAMVMTAANLGIALFLYSILTGSIRALTSKGSAESETTLPLMPFFVGLLIATLLLPVLAITWGARPSDVLEVWRILTVGADVGGMRLSLSVIFSLVFVFFIGVVITRWMQRGLRETVLPRTKMDAGAQNALITGLGYVGMTLSALIAVSVAGLNLSNLAVVAGALSVGIGFGLQTIVSNFVSGIILLIERPIAEGDWIEVSGHSGIVKKIAVRSTQIATFDKHDVIVPNQDLIGGAVKNMTLSSRMGRLIIPVGVAYGSDLEKTKEILETAAADEGSLVQHPAPSVLFRG
ncbi:Mechanosensitive ion channel, partial [Shimia gijangensis]